MRAEMAGRTKKWMMLSLMLCITAFISIQVFASQTADFRLDMDSLNLQRGVSTRIVVSLINAQGAQIVSIDGLDDFDVFSSSQSASTSIINGVSSFQADLQYTIMPKATGEFTLKAVILYEGQYYETNALEVTVSEVSSGDGTTSPDLFVSTVLSHNEAYLGEKVIVTYELYTRYEIEAYGFTEYIAIDGVIAKQMPNDRLRTESVYIDGNRYVMYEAAQFVIDPIRPGMCVIPSFDFQVNVLTNGGLASFFRMSEPVYLQTEDAELLVKALPSQGRPDNFSGIVGEINIDSRYSREVVNYGDSFTLQAELSGNANLDGLRSITGGVIPGFTVYENQRNTTETVQDGQYFAIKSFESILVPEMTGTLEIEPIHISYFSPVTASYETAVIPGVSIEVLGEIPLQNAIGGDQLPFGTETVLINQVHYTDLSDSYFAFRIKKTTAYAIMVGFGVLIIIVYGWFWLFSKSKKHDPELKAIYKRLAASKDINEVYNLFSAMVKQRFNVSLKAASRDAVLAGLPDAGLAAQVTDIMDYMESAAAHDDYLNIKSKIKDIYINLTRS